METFAYLLFFFGAGIVASAGVHILTGEACLLYRDIHIHSAVAGIVLIGLYSSEGTFLPDYLLPSLGAVGYALYKSWNTWRIYNLPEGLTIESVSFLLRGLGMEAELKGNHLKLAETTLTLKPDYLFIEKPDASFDLNHLAYRLQASSPSFSKSLWSGGVFAGIGLLALLAEFLYF